MKRALFLLSLAALLTGCSMVSGARHPDGRLVVTSWRFLWKSEAIRFTASDMIGTNNQPLHVTLSIGKSATDSESVGAVTEGITKAVIKSTVPIP